MRCKACDVELNEIRNRNVIDEMGRIHVLMEDLCPRCIMESRHQRHNNAEKTILNDEELYEAFQTLRY